MLPTCDLSPVNPCVYSGARLLLLLKEYMIMCSKIEKALSFIRDTVKAMLLTMGPTTPRGPDKSKWMLHGECQGAMSLI